MQVNSPHVVDMRPARVAGRQLLASNDPKSRDAEFEQLQRAPHGNAERDLADQLEAEREMRSTEVPA